MDSPLHYSAIRGHLEVAKVLVEPWIVHYITVL